MNNEKSKFFPILTVVVGFFMLSTPMFAHHGSGISYDMTKPWTTKAVVTDWKFINPHPILLFDITDEKGNVAHWHSEIITQPSQSHLHNTFVLSIRLQREQPVQPRELYGI
jgi:Family of unknown function (DUF6152)